MTTGNKKKDATLAIKESLIQGGRPEVQSVIGAGFTPGNESSFARANHVAFLPASFENQRH